MFWVEVNIKPKTNTPISNFEALVANEYLCFIPMVSYHIRLIKFHKDRSKFD